MMKSNQLYQYKNYESKLEILRQKFDNQSFSNREMEENLKLIDEHIPSVKSNVNQIQANLNSYGILVNKIVQKIQSISMYLN